MWMTNFIQYNMFFLRIRIQQKYLYMHVLYQTTKDPNRVSYFKNSEHYAETLVRIEQKKNHWYYFQTQDIHIKPKKSSDAHERRVWKKFMWYPCTACLRIHWNEYTRVTPKGTVKVSGSLEDTILQLFLQCCSTENHDLTNHTTLVPYDSWYESVFCLFLGWKNMCPIFSLRKISQDQCPAVFSRK